MRNQIKRTLALCFLISSICLLPAFASGSSAESTRNADILFDLGLFQGTSKGYELDQSPTRVQGIIMLIRASGGSIPIPANGCILWFGSEYTATDYYQAPVVGEQVSLTPYLFQEDEEGFSADHLVAMVSGAPRLVKDGVIETYLDPGFNEARFTTASTTRTAIGTLANGKLLLVSVGPATIQQVRELLLALGGVDAVNLDGGASTGMYYNGSYIRSPGRALTTTLQVFVAE